jgi:hypothetical protein
MRLFSTLSLLSFLTGFVYAEFQMTRHVSLAPRLQHAAVLPKAEFSSTFTSRVPRGKYKKHLLAVVHGKHRESGGTIVPVAGTDLDKVYLTNLTVGGQEFSVIVDTGRFIFFTLIHSYPLTYLTLAPIHGLSSRDSIVQTSTVLLCQLQLVPLALNFRPPTPRRSTPSQI